MGQDEKEDVTRMSSMSSSSQTSYDDGGGNANANESNEDTTAFSLDLDEGGFQELVTDINEVLQELAQDRAMDAFRGEYEKLFGALEKSHANENRLNTRCSYLMTVIAQQRVNVDDAKMKSEEDRENVTSLKGEVCKAWKSVDATQEREEKARETIETLNTEIQALTKVIEEKIVGSEDINLSGLRKTRDELTAQRDTLKIELKELKVEHEGNLTVIKDLTEEGQTLKGTVTTLRNELSLKTNELNREIRRKERSDREVKQLNVKLEDKQREMENLAVNVDLAEKDTKILEGTLVTQKTFNDQLKSSHQRLKRTILQLQDEIDTHSFSAKQLSDQVDKKKDELTQSNEAVKHFKSDVAVKSKVIDELKFKYADQVKTCEKLKSGQTKLKVEVGKTKQQTLDMMQQSLKEKNMFQEKKNEITSLEHVLDEADAISKKQQSKMNVLMHQVSETKRSLQMVEKTCENQKKLIARAENDRDRYHSDSNELAERVEVLLDDVRKADMSVTFSKKEVIETESRRRRQQNLYQAARDERNILSKTVAEYQEKIVDLGDKLKVLHHQFDQMKEDAAVKEALLLKERVDRRKMFKDIFDLQAEVEKCHHQISEMKQLVQESQRSSHVARDQLRAQDGYLSNCTANLETALKERTLINNQQSKSNSRCKSLDRRVLILEKTLSRGDSKYQEREEDIKSLTLEVKKLKQENAAFDRNARTIEELKKSNLLLQKELGGQKAKLKDAQCEMESPFNVHRWRILEGKDPSSKELIKKIHLLQRRLIAKSHERCPTFELDLFNATLYFLNL
jgi:chromosome segregation ATPase